MLWNAVRERFGRNWRDFCGLVTFGLCVLCVCVCVCVVCVFVQWVNSGPRDKDLFHGQCPDRSVTGPMFAHDEADVLRPTHVRIN